MGNKTLIAYTSKGGAARQTSEIMAEILRDKQKYEVDLADLRKTTPKLAEYNKIVVEVNVRGGKVYSEGLEFLKQDFGEKSDLLCAVVEAFGGQMKVLGKTVFDNFKPEKIREWAEELNA